MFSFFLLMYFAWLLAVATHSSVLAWRIPGTAEPGGLPSLGSHSWTQLKQLHFHFSLSCIGEGNGNPLQCSCLENPRGGGAWWAAIYGVAQNRTRLKRLSSSSSRKNWIQILRPCLVSKLNQTISVKFLHLKEKKMIASRQSREA